MKNQSRGVLIFSRVAAIIAAAFSLAGCDRDPDTRILQEGTTENPIQVQEPVRVVKDKFVRSLFVSGELSAVRSVGIELAPFLGRGPFIIKTLVPEGAFVQPGDLLIQLDNSALVAELEAEEVNLERAQNDLDGKEAEMEAWLTEYEIALGRAALELERARLNSLIPKDLVALRDWQEYQFAFEKAKKELKRATESLEFAKKMAIEEVEKLKLRKAQISTNISRLQRSIAATEIRAVSAGTVMYEFCMASDDRTTTTRRKMRVGDMAYWGMNLLIIPDLREMEVRAFINEVDGGLVHAGQPARIVVDAQPDREYGGQVAYVPEVAERSGRYSTIRIFPSRIRLNRTDPEIMKPGMSVRVEILLEEREGLMLPRHAVFQEQESTFVRLITGEKREIEVAARNATHCLIEGLAEGTELKP